MAFKIELGSEVEDRITGFKGVVIGRTEWFYGCIAYTVAPKGLTKEGKRKDSDSFDEDRLIVTKAMCAHRMRETGGPAPAAKAVKR